jgi:hypothetical protein
LDVNNYQEANLLFACYALFLALGHTLLCKTMNQECDNRQLPSRRSQCCQASSQSSTQSNQQSLMA